MTPVLKYLRWLKISERIRYKLLPVTYQIFTTSQSACLYSSISLQPSITFVVILARSSARV